MGDLIDGCFVFGGFSVDYNGPGYNSEEPSNEMGSVSLLADALWLVDAPLITMVQVATQRSQAKELSFPAQ